jgi:hypothetical protein
MKSLSARYLGAPRGLIRALSKIGPLPWTREGYLALLRVLEEGGDAAKRVMHARRLTEDEVLVLVHLPPALRREPYLAACRTPWAAAYLAWLHERATQAGRPLRERALRRAAALHWSEFGGLFADVDFPAPPFVPDGFEHIADARRLRKAAREMSNCLATRQTDAERGDNVYYFSATGMVVEVEKVDGFGWRLTQAKGRRNRRLSNAERREVRDAFEKEGVFVGPLEGHPEM